MKIDTTKIEGFDKMTAEEQKEALLAYEFEETPPKPDNSKGEIDKLKQALSKANSEAADWKRQLRERQTQAEREEAERKEQEAAAEAQRQAMRDELEQYKQKERVARDTSELLKIGFDATTAETMAKSLPDGVNADFYTALGTFFDTQKQKYQIEALNKQPTITAGTPVSSKAAQEKEMEQYRKWFGLK